MTGRRIGLVQTTTGIDADRNAAMIAQGLRACADAGAELVFTPEMSGLLDRDRARLRARARTEADDPTLAAARAVAAERGVWVQLGSLAVRPEVAVGADGPEGKLVNRAFLIDADGAIRARYDKIHLFQADLGAGGRYDEGRSFKPGSRAVVADTPLGRVALSICYDVRFPLLFAELAAALPVLIAVPAAFTRPTGAAHWEVLLRARAIEAGAFVVAAAQTGAHADGRETWGHSLVAAPWGEVLLDMGEAPGTAVVDLNLDEVTRARARVPAVGNRRGFGPPVRDPEPG